MVYQIGQEVFRCEPFVYVVSNQALSTVCDFCMESKSGSSGKAGGNFNCSTMKRCSRCKTVYYCDALCQKNAWRNHHKDECLYLKEVEPIIHEIPDLVRIMIRTVLKLKNGGEKQYATLPNGKKRYFHDLISHQNEIICDSTKMQDFQFSYNLLQVWFKDQVPSRTVMLDIFGKLVINQFGISNESIEFVGIALYLLSSVLDHSCAPNVQQIFKGKEMIVRAIENVDHFSDLRISYTRLIDTTEKRRQDLLEQYYFFCECPKCLDLELDQLKFSMICAECYGGCIPVSTGICIDCKHPVEKQQLDKYENIKSEIGNLISEPTENKMVYQQLYNRAKFVLHPYDKDFVDLLKEYYFKQLCDDNNTRCLEIGNLLLKSYYKHLPEYNKLTGLTEMTVAKICNGSNLLDEADYHLDKAEKILKVTHGNDHSRLTKDCQLIRKSINLNRKMININT